jgi:hypothetical protein
MACYSAALILAILALSALLLASSLALIYESYKFS